MFKKGDVLVYLGGEDLTFNTDWSDLLYYEYNLRIGHLCEYEVEEVLEIEPDTFIKLYDFEFYYPINDFCFQKDKRLRRSKLKKIMSKL